MDIVEQYKLLGLLKLIYENKKISKRNYQNLVSGIRCGKITKLPAKYFGDRYIQIFTQNEDKMLSECLKEHKIIEPYFQQSKITNNK